MRKLSILLLALAACDIRPPDHEIRFDLTREELDAPPSYHQWKGALLMDIRVWRELEKKASEGNRRCSALAYDEDGLAVCAHDEEPFLIFDLTKDLPDTQNRIRELAYLCQEESVYYYHYIGGPYRIDTWQGPFRIARRRAKVDLGGDEQR